ncbi:hypothetical protein D9M72_357930 [compost metagenome]
MSTQKELHRGRLIEFRGPSHVPPYPQKMLVGVTARQGRAARSLASCRHAEWLGEVAARSSL